MNKIEYKYFKYSINYWNNISNSNIEIPKYKTYKIFINEKCNLLRKKYSKKPFSKVSIEQKIICPKFIYSTKNEDNFYSIDALDKWKRECANLKLDIPNIKKNYNIKIKNLVNHHFNNVNFGNKPNNYFPNHNIYTKNNYIIIGDIHGDINQFLSGLINQHIIKDIQFDYVNNKLIFNKDINFENYNVIFLGDIFHYQVYDDIIANTILDLIEYNNFKWILGNHDSLIMSYALLKNKKDFLKIYNFKLFKHIFKSCNIEYQILFNELFDKIYPDLNNIFSKDDMSYKMIKAMREYKIVYSLVINNYFVSHANITLNGIKEFIMLIKYENSFVFNTSKNDFIISNQNMKHLFNSINNEDYMLNINKRKLFLIKKNMDNPLYISNTLNELFLYLNGLYFLQKIQLLNVVSPDCLFNSICGHISGIKLINNIHSKYNIMNFKSCFNPIQRNINCKIGILNYNGTVTHNLDFASSVEYQFYNDKYDIHKYSQPDYLIIELNEFKYSNINKIFCILTNKETKKKKIKIYNSHEFYQDYDND